MWSTRGADFWLFLPGDGVEVCQEPPVPRVSNSRGSFGALGAEWANAAGFLGQRDYSTANPLAEFPATTDIQAPRFRQTRKSKEVFRISSFFINMDGISKDITIPFSEATKVERLSSHAYKVNLVDTFCIGTGEFNTCLARHAPATRHGI